ANEGEPPSHQGGLMNDAQEDVNTPTTPKRIQRRRTKGWRAPDGAVNIGRPSRWGNPYKLGETLVRYPANNGDRWELEGPTGKTPGEVHHFRHPDGTITWHRVELASAQQVMELYRRFVESTTGYVDRVRNELAGRDLMCWCPLDRPCHGDVLIDIANPGARHGWT